MFPLSGAHSFLSRLSNSGDVFEKETSLESSRRLLAKVIRFFVACYLLILSDLKIYLKITIEKACIFKFMDFYLAAK